MKHCSAAAASARKLSIFCCVLLYGFAALHVSAVGLFYFSLTDPVQLLICCSAYLEVCETTINKTGSFGSVLTSLLSIEHEYACHAVC